jgi:hypothetical protein
MYSLYFPLMALARYARAVKSGVRSQRSEVRGQGIRLFKA